MDLILVINRVKFYIATKVKAKKVFLLVSCLYALFPLLSTLPPFLLQDDYDLVPNFNLSDNHRFGCLQDGFNIPSQPDIPHSDHSKHRPPLEQDNNRVIQRLPIRAWVTKGLNCCWGKKDVRKLTHLQMMLAFL